MALGVSFNPQYQPRIQRGPTAMEQLFQGYQVGQQQANREKMFNLQERQFEAQEAQRGIANQFTEDQASALDSHRQETYKLAREEIDYKKALAKAKAVEKKAVANAKVDAKADDRLKKRFDTSVSTLRTITDKVDRIRSVIAKLPMSAKKVDTMQAIMAMTSDIKGAKIDPTDVEGSIANLKKIETRLVTRGQAIDMSGMDSKMSNRIKIQFPSIWAIEDATTDDPKNDPAGSLTVASNKTNPVANNYLANLVATMNNEPQGRFVTAEEAGLGADVIPTDNVFPAGNAPVVQQPLGGNVIQNAPPVVPQQVMGGNAIATDLHRDRFTGQVIDKNMPYSQDQLTAFSNNMNDQQTKEVMWLRAQGMSATGAISTVMGN